MKRPQTTEIGLGQMNNKILWLVESYVLVITLLLTSCICATAVTKLETTTPTLATFVILLSDKDFLV